MAEKNLFYTTIHFYWSGICYIQDLICLVNCYGIHCTNWLTFDFVQQVLIFKSIEVQLHQSLVVSCIVESRLVTSQDNAVDPATFRMVSESGCFVAAWRY